MAGGAESREREERMRGWMRGWMEGKVAEWPDAGGARRRRG